MELTRRGFLKGILLAGIAPAIVRADSLMRIIPTETLFPIEIGYDDNWPPGFGSLLWPGVKQWWGYDLATKKGDHATAVLFEKNIETGIVTVKDMRIALPSSWPK